MAIPTALIIQLARPIPYGRPSPYPVRGGYAVQTETQQKLAKHPAQWAG